MIENVRVAVPAYGVWAYAQEHPEELNQNYIVLAENTKTGLSLTLSNGADGLPALIVLDDDDVEIYEELIVDSPDAIRSYNEAMSDFLDDDWVGTLRGKGHGEAATPEEKERRFNEMEIRDREHDLMLAFTDFLDEVSNGFVYYEDFFEDVGDLEAVLDNVLDVIACTGFPVYRPTVIDTDSGDEIYLEFPYDEASYEAGLR